MALIPSIVGKTPCFLYFTDAVYKILVSLECPLNLKRGAVHVPKKGR